MFGARTHKHPHVSIRFATMKARINWNSTHEDSEGKKTLQPSGRTEFKQTVSELPSALG